MSDHTPEQRGYNGHEVPMQDEAGSELYQIRPYYDDNAYDYRDQRHSTRNLNSYTNQQSSNVYPQYHGYINQGYNAYAWGTYNTGYSETTYNTPGDTSYHHYSRPARYQPRNWRKDIAPDPAVPRSPSPSYISTSLLPSLHTEPPSRKLLILDLNGTLLFRSKPVLPPRPPAPLNPETTLEKASSHPSYPQTPPPFQPLKRTVHQRPYLACFREYLFHASTTKWLDVMIWSSAQPHSVKDMLKCCFPREGEDGSDAKSDERFVAVWARDTLGLSRVDYSRKSQTTKDLHKPWSQLPLRSDPDTAASGQELPQCHSARTTLLLDDSPLKAHLQPWNHVCLREYDANARGRDVKALETIRNQDNQESPDTAPPSLTSQPPFDPTLLAVTGVLEAIRHESNVAGWIRAGGLWAENSKEVPDAEDVASTSGTSDVETTSSQPASGTKRGRADEDVDQPAKRARLNSPRPDTTPCPPTDPPSATPLPVAPDSTLHPDLPVASIPVSDAQNPADAAASQSDSPLWFTSAAAFDYWVLQGRETLRRMEISEEHGVVVDEETETTP